MADDYTPTTERVRTGYIESRIPAFGATEIQWAAAADEFDDWLAEVVWQAKAEVRGAPREGWFQAAGYEYATEYQRTPRRAVGPWEDWIAGDQG